MNNLRPKGLALSFPHNIYNKRTTMQEKLTKSYPSEIVQFLINILKRNVKYNGLKITLSRHYKKEYDSIFSLTSFFDKNTGFIPRLYCILHNIHDPPICQVCKKPVRFQGLYYGFFKTCSPKCSANNINRINKTKTTCQRKYGVDNVYQAKSIKDKIKETVFKKYGVSHPKLSKEVNEKTKKTCLLRYGQTSYSKTDEWKERMLQIKECNGTLYWPNIGNNETKILDAIEQQLGFRIERQYRIGYYFVDGYCKENNTVYEVYERRHHYKKETNKDKKRQNHIQDRLKCGFVIINDFNDQNVRLPNC